jgi:hypothetical protein
VSEAAPDADGTADGAVEQVVDDAAKAAERAVTLVTRLGGAFSAGFQDGRERS